MRPDDERRLGLFLYGTLRPTLDLPMYRYLSRFLKPLGRGTVRGRLYDVGRYPAVVLSEDPAEIVHGEVFEVHHPEPLLTVLDAYERCSPQDFGGAEYRRERAAVTLATGRTVDAWIYVYNRSTAGLTRIPEGDYLAHRRRQSPEGPAAPQTLIDKGDFRLTEIIHPAIESYLATLLPARDPLLLELERYAQAHDVPIIGPHGARFLALIARIKGARHVLEVGTAIGYSTIWLARATAAWGGRVTTVEIDPQTAALARRHLERAGVAERVEVIVGDGLEVVSALEGPFEMAFLDGDKGQYRPLTELLAERMPPGAVLMADNVLWSARVVEPEPDATTRAILAYNRFLSEHPAWESVIVPLRDGISVGVRR